MNINVVWMGDLNDWEIGNCRKQLQQSSGKLLIAAELIEVWILSFPVFALSHACFSWSNFVSGRESRTLPCWIYCLYRFVS